MVVEGSASLQVQSYPSEIQSSFNKLCEHLEKDFGRFSCQEADIEAIRGREGKQKPNESPSEFLRRLQRLFSRAFGKNFQGRDDVQLWLSFVDGLLPHVRQQLEALAISDLDDLIAKAEIFHHKRSRTREIQVCEIRDRAPLNLEGVAQGRSTWPNQRDNFKRIRRGDCYRCGEPGHHARECHQGGRIQTQPVNRGASTSTNQDSSIHAQDKPQDNFMDYLRKIIDGYEKQTAQVPVATSQEPVATQPGTQTEHWDEVIAPIVVEIEHPITEIAQDTSSMEEQETDGISPNVSEESSSDDTDNGKQDGTLFVDERLPVKEWSMLSVRISRTGYTHS